MNLLPLIRRLSIVNKSGQIVPLEPNWAQLRVIYETENALSEGRPIRIASLKARQIGISTIIEALGFVFCMIFDNTRGLVVANENDNAQHLLGITHTYWDTYPFKTLMTPKYVSRNELAWHDTNSSLKVATARNAKVGRGRTIRFLHASECAFWEEAGKTMLGLRQALPELPGTFLGLESTANGVGNWFYNTWMAAESGDVDYIPLFFPWHQHPEYLASYINMPYHSLIDLDDEERLLQNIGISDDRLAWRRWAIKNLADNDIHKFHQEYPTTPEEAFIATGTNVFPVGKLATIYEPMQGRRGRLARDGNNVRFQPDIEGPLTVYRLPSSDQDWGVYIIGGDPTHTTRGDYAVAQVLSRRTLEQVAVLRMRCDPGSFGEELAKLGTFYNSAVLVPEVEGPGYATVSRLIGMNYPYVWKNRLADTTPGKTSDHHGWRTTAHSKELAVGWLLKMVVDGANEKAVGLPHFTIHDSSTFREMRDYVTLESGGYGPADENGYDDTVMSMAIAMTAHILEPPMMPYQGPHSGGAGGSGEPVWESWQEQEEAG